MTELGKSIVKFIQSQLNSDEPNFSDLEVTDIASGLKIKQEAIKGAMSLLLEEGYIESNLVDVNGKLYTFLFLTEKGWNVTL